MVKTSVGWSAIQLDIRSDRIHRTILGHRQSTEIYELSEEGEDYLQQIILTPSARIERKITLIFLISELLFVHAKDVTEKGIVCLGALNFAFSFLRAGERRGGGERERERRNIKLSENFVILLRDSLTLVTFMIILLLNNGMAWD